MHIKFLASALIAALLMTGTPTRVSPASGQGVQSPNPTVAAATLTEAEAAAIALEHAGLSQTEVTGLRVRMDRDDRQRHWDVQWRSGDWVYDYDIDLTTGAVLDWERDHDPVPKAEPKPTEPKPTEPPKTAEPSYLTAAQAKAIALEHAGLTADQVKGLRAEFDRDDRTPVYEIEFRANGYEYDYEIHAETGRIREFDKEWDD